MKMLTSEPSLQAIATRVCRAEKILEPYTTGEHGPALHADVCTAFREVKDAYAMLRVLIHKEHYPTQPTANARYAHHVHTTLGPVCNALSESERALSKVYDKLQRGGLTALADDVASVGYTIAEARKSMVAAADCISIIDKITT